ncbi:MAG TPA: GGDEF domain-containing protein [Candidatus Acidoferrales bacterium]|nr:GGDEF domain-containing protein [Candidatus Acidoferrales bacterium]
MDGPQIVGAETAEVPTFGEWAKRQRALWWWLAGAAMVLGAAGWLRRVESTPDPLLFAQLQFASGILAFTFAGNALVKFRGAGDRLALILTCGFVFVGIALTSSSAVSLRLLESDREASLRDPLTWVVGRTLLAVLLVAALLVEWHIPTARHPGWEIAVALGVVLASTSLLATAHWSLPADILWDPRAAFPRPGNLVPAALFLAAAAGYQRRLRNSSTPFDRSLVFACALNFACCLAASQSERKLDAPFVFAGMLQFTSYAVLLVGALFDNAQLLERVRQMASSDPLTGLANFRRLVDVVESEIQRSSRSGRPFAVLLFDLNGLKQINDRFGHLVGSRALCRFANVLRVHSRAMDTCARYGGDEFVLVLPETGPEAAQEVLRRISERLAQDTEKPPVSAGAGMAIYPEDGETIDALLAAADQRLYRVKGRTPKKLAARR